MMREYIEEAEKALLHTYNRYQVVLDRGMAYISMMWKENAIWISCPELRYLPWDITTGRTMMR